MDLLRKRSLLQILENNGFRRVSFKGLTVDYYIAFGILNAAYKRTEAYEMLQILNDEGLVLDSSVIIYLDDEKGPVMFQDQEYYHPNDYKRIFESAQITVPANILQEFLSLII